VLFLKRPLRRLYISNGKDVVGFAPHCTVRFISNCIVRFCI
jgi:hypothetical protein